MSDNRQLVDAIKTRFARRSTAQLELVAGGTQPQRWSAEAVTAARETLAERRSGDAQEPETPEEDELPEYHYEPDDLALGVLSGLLTGHLEVPYHQRVEVPDYPVPFGHKMAWLVLATTDTRAVATALRLQGGREATWGDGVEAAHRGSVFITPPVGDWTLVVGTPLFQMPERTAAVLKPLLERLGRQFDDAQYLCNHLDADLYVWARAQRGTLVRGYGWLGAQSRTLWDEGAPTDEERDLGFQFASAEPPKVNPGDGSDPLPFAEDNLFQLATYWSIDPTSLDVEYHEPQSGLLGRISLA